MGRRPPPSSPRCWHAACASASAASVLVCQSRGGAARFGRLHGPGWRDLGLEPADLLILRARREKDVPWAMEEGLRSGALAAVLAEAESIEFTASRRLALAAAEGATPALLLRHDELGPASAALTRWRVTALPGCADPFDEGAPGLPRWRLALARARGGRLATCEVEWNRETGDFRVAAALADRPAAPRASASEVEAPRRARGRAHTPAAEAAKAAAPSAPVPLRAGGAGAAWAGAVGGQPRGRHKGADIRYAPCRRPRLVRGPRHGARRSGGGPAGARTACAVVQPLHALVRGGRRRGR